MSGSSSEGLETPVSIEQQIAEIDWSAPLPMNIAYGLLTHANVQAALGKPLGKSQAELLRLIGLNGKLDTLQGYYLEAWERGTFGSRETAFTLANLLGLKPV